MAQIILTIPDAIVQRVIEATCNLEGYNDTLPNGDPNPQTKAQFTKQFLINTLKGNVKLYESKAAAQSASATAGAAADSEIVIT